MFKRILFLIIIIFGKQKDNKLKKMENTDSNIVTLTFEALDTVPENLVAFLDSYFTVSTLNYTDEGKEEYVGYTDLSFDQKDFEDKATAQNIKLPAYRLQKLENKNWLEECAPLFAPTNMGDFCVYGTHEEKKPKTRKIPLQINATTAFGSTHATTHLCLELLSMLSKMTCAPKKILDIGTGSGILALASAKKWGAKKTYILGVDIDKEALRSTRKNIDLNHQEGRIDVALSNGRSCVEMQKNAPFDLVFANILANPLIGMVKQIKKYTVPKGFVILSGFLPKQQDMIINTYQKNGFKLIKSMTRHNWSALLLEKKETISEIKRSLREDEALLLTRDNMFLKEDVLSCENKILELSGFSGSAGMMLFTHSNTWLFVDGRYYIQARKEAKKDITIIDSQNFIFDLVALVKKQNLHKLIVNPWSISTAFANFLKSEKIAIKEDINAPMSGFFGGHNVFKQKLRYAGKTSYEKCALLCAHFKKDYDALLITSSADVSWLSNLRAYDLPDSPVLRAYGLLDKSGKLRIYDYSKRKNLISQIRKYTKVMADFLTTPLAIKQACSNLENVAFEELAYQKLHKNDTELQGFIDAHKRDGVALANFLYWLENNDQDLSELDVVEKLNNFRQKEKLYFSNSFATIAAFGKNAAIVHYTPRKKTNRRLQKNDILLLDSGGQYYNGTTDVTRTVAFGTIKNDIKESYTMVLKAHIALADFVFKEGTEACVLDAVCRRVLQGVGKDYAHGTGHSVGHFSNVHEGPFFINAKNTTPVHAHYVTSIEPGYYLEGKYGIRIENMVYTEYTKDNKNLCFKPLTLCPICTELLIKRMLTEEEKAWLNTYHKEVYETLAPLLEKEVRLWLKEKCRAI